MAELPYFLCSSVQRRPFIAALIFSLSASVFALAPRFVRPLPGTAPDLPSEFSSKAAPAELAAASAAVESSRPLGVREGLAELALLAGPVCVGLGGRGKLAKG